MLRRADPSAGAVALKCFASCHFPTVPRRTKTHHNLCIFRISDVLVRATFGSAEETEAALAQRECESSADSGGQLMSTTHARAQHQID